MKSCRVITLYQLHLPSEVRIFEHTSEPTYMDSHAMVIDSVVVENDILTYCRGYYFFDKWLSVFMTFDGQLELKPDSNSVFPFVFNCDITTPHYCRSNSIFTSDLYIDVLVKVDGYTYQIKDVGDFERAFSIGLFGKRWYEGAKQEADWLVCLLERNRFLDFLNEVAPFPKTKLLREQNRFIFNPRRCHIDEIDFEYHPQYPRYR